MSHYIVTVKDSEGGVIKTSGYMPLTDGTGRFQVTNLVTGTYTIDVSGYIQTGESSYSLIATGTETAAVSAAVENSVVIEIDTFDDAYTGNITVGITMPVDVVINNTVTGTLSWTLAAIGNDELSFTGSETLSGTALEDGVHTLVIDDGNIPAGRYLLTVTLDNGTPYSSVEAVIAYPGLPSTGTLSLDSRKPADYSFTVTDMVGGELAVNGEGEYVAETGSFVVTLEKGLSGTETAIWYVDGEETTVAGEGNAYTISGLDGGRHIVVLVVYDTALESAVGSLTMAVDVQGTIGIEEGAKFINYASNIYDNNNVSELGLEVMYNPFVYVDEDNYISSVSSDNTQKVEILRNIVEMIASSAIYIGPVTDEVVVQNWTTINQMLFGFRISHLLNEHELYIRMDTNLTEDEIDYFMLQGSIVGGSYNNATMALTLEYNNGVLSTTTENKLAPIEVNLDCMQIMMIYGLPLVLSSKPLPDYTDMVINNLVVVDLDENRAYFNEKGLNDNHEIKEYLDGLKYEDFTAPDRVTMTVPRNLINDIKYGSEDLPGVIATGTADNMVTSLGSSVGMSNIPAPEVNGIVGTIEPKSYYTQSLNAMLLAYSDDKNISELPFNHKFYLSFDTDLSTSSSLLITASLTLNPFADASQYQLIFNKASSPNGRERFSLIGSALDIDGCETGWGWIILCYIVHHRFLLLVVY